MSKYSGCNCWKDFDEDTGKLLGTGTSMHECGDCPGVELGCKLAQDVEEGWTIPENFDALAKSELKRLDPAMQEYHRRKDKEYE